MGTIHIIHFIGFIFFTRGRATKDEGKGGCAGASTGSSKELTILSELYAVCSRLTTSCVPSGLLSSMITIS